MAFSAAKLERYAALGRERLRTGDLFEHPVVVVPIKTKGRWYGSISRAVVGKGVQLPELALGCAEYRALEGGRAYLFVALWNDENTYSPALIYECTGACLRLAARHALELVAFPLLGGNQGHRFIGAMELAVDDAMDECAEAELAMPEVIFVTDHELA